jgi:hypothetical protein
VVGNVPLAVDGYPFQYSGSPDGRTGNQPVPGAVARLRTATTFHEILLQLENSEARRIRLAGGALLEEQRIPAHRYVRDRRFVLPDRNITGLEVYVADPDGTVLAGSAVTDGPRRFRRLVAGDGEYVVDRVAGILRVSAAVAELNRLVAVYYEDSSGRPVGSTGAGNTAIVPLDPVSLAPTSGPLLPFSFDRGEIYPGGPAGSDYRLPLSGGRDALILSASGRWSPFETANLYQLPAGVGSPEENSFRLELVRRGTRTPIDDAADYVVRTIGATALVEVVRRDGETGSLTWRYPFAARSPREANAGIYGPAAQPETPAGDVEILLAYEIEQDEVILDGDVVPGTVVVTVDGRPLGGVEFDPAAGILTLPDSISATSTVDVAYRVYSDGDGAGDLVFISGNRWDPGPQLSLTLATGLRWTLAEQTFSTETDQHPGRLTVSSGATWRGEGLRLDAAAALQVSRSDTTGFMRLAGRASRPRKSPQRRALPSRLHPAAEETSSTSTCAPRWRIATTGPSTRWETSHCSHTRSRHPPTNPGAAAGSAPTSPGVPTLPIPEGSPSSTGIRSQRRNGSASRFMSPGERRTCGTRVPSRCGTGYCHRQAATPRPSHPGVHRCSASASERTPRISTPTAFSTRGPVRSIP